MDPWIQKRSMIQYASTDTVYSVELQWAQVHHGNQKTVVEGILGVPEIFDWCCKVGVSIRNGWSG